MRPTTLVKKGCGVANQRTAKLMATLTPERMRFISKRLGGGEKASSSPSSERPKIIARSRKERGGTLAVKRARQRLWSCPSSQYLRAGLKGSRN